MNQLAHLIGGNVLPVVSAAIGGCGRHETALTGMSVNNKVCCWILRLSSRSLVLCESKLCLVRQRPALTLAGLNPFLEVVPAGCRMFLSTT